MSFAHPAVLLALGALVALAAMYVVARRRRRVYAMRFTNLALAESVMGPRPGRRRHLPPAMFLLGLAALIAGLAGPILHLEVAQRDASVMLVIDTSGSMAATDVAPTRMDAAKSAAQKLIDELPSTYRVGLVSFNGFATLAAPLTGDRRPVREALAALHPGGATAIGDALVLAAQQLTPAPGTTRVPAMIVLLTDGVNNRGADPLAGAAAAKSAGITVQTVGVGTQDNSVKVQGQEVGGVDEQALSAVAAATGGRYYHAEAASTLTQIYSALGSSFGWRPYSFDMTVPVLVVSGLVVFVALTLSLLWFRVLP